MILELSHWGDQRPFVLARTIRLCTGLPLFTTEGGGLERASPLRQCQGLWWISYEDLKQMMQVPSLVMSRACAVSREEEHFRLPCSWGPHERPPESGRLWEGRGKPSQMVISQEDRRSIPSKDDWLAHSILLHMIFLQSTQHRALAEYVPRTIQRHSQGLEEAWERAKPAGSGAHQAMPWLRGLMPLTHVCGQLSIVVHACESQEEWFRTILNIYVYVMYSEALWPWRTSSPSCPSRMPHTGLPGMELWLARWKSTQVWHPYKQRVSEEALSRSTSVWTIAVPQRHMQAGLIFFSL